MVTPTGSAPAPDGDAAASTVGRLVGAFVARTLPHAEWTHEAHLRVGLWHAIHHAGGALPLLRERIIRYNESVGTLNTDDSGYHETITRFYVGLIRWFVDERDGSLPVDELADELIRCSGHRRLALVYFSEERLMSIAARRGWVPPDREALPFAVPD